MIDVLERITAYRTQKGWSEYQLAEKSGLTQSTISSWYRKNLVPSIPSLEKICKAFGITRGRKIFCVYGKNSSLIRNRYV